MALTKVNTDLLEDGGKLDGIEAGADVTDTTNVTAAGALMDSELTSIASVKALNQGVATTDSPTFAALNVNGTATMDGLVTQAAANTYPAGAAQIKSLAGDISYITNVGGNFLISNSSTTDQFVLSSAGHVGIGTSSPNIASFGKALTITDPASTNQIPAIELAFGSNTRGANIAVDNRASVKALAITAVASDLAMTFGTNNTERMRIDSAGNVGIGTDSPSSFTGYTNVSIKGGYNGSNLDFHNSSGTRVSAIVSNPSADFTVETNTTIPLLFKTNSTERMRITSGGILEFNDNAVISVNDTADSMYLGGGGTLPNTIQSQASALHNWQIGASNVMRIDSAGNLLVGKSAADVGATAGFEWYNTADVLTLTRDAGNALSVNRLTSDGVLATFRKDGTTVGSIGSNSGYMVIGSPVGTDAHLLIGNGLIHPATSTGSAKDNAIDIGGSSNRFKDLYLSGKVQASYIYRADASGAGLHFTTNAIYPTNETAALSDGTESLGAAAYRFKDLYLSGGVYLGGTGAANKLDDYEEGSFNLGIQVGTLGATSKGKYTKIGNQVTVFCQVDSGTDYSNVNTLTLTGLPFTAISPHTTGHAGNGAVSYTANMGSDVISAVAGSGTTTVFFSRINSDTLTYANCIGIWSVRFTLTYQTA